MYVTPSSHESFSHQIEETMSDDEIIIDIRITVMMAFMTAWTLKWTDQR